MHETSKGGHHVEAKPCRFVAWYGLGELDGKLGSCQVVHTGRLEVEGSLSRFVSAAATKPSCSPHHRDAVLKATYVVFCAVCAGGQT
jgi:hypothetical protein